MAINTKMTCPGTMETMASKESFNKERQSQSAHFQLNVVYIKARQIKTNMPVFLLFF